MRRGGGCEEEEGVSGKEKERRRKKESDGKGWSKPEEMKPDPNMVSVLRHDQVRWQNNNSRAPTDQCATDTSIANIIPIVNTYGLSRRSAQLTSVSRC